MNDPFIKQLRHVVRSLKRMKPGEVHVLSINANYGHYQVVIGPKQQGEKAAKGMESRPIEINGEIHHLFISPHAVRVYPSKGQILHNLRDTVIMRDLEIHLHDPMGDGRHLAMMEKGDNGIHARECINLAGNEGEKLLEKAEHDTHLSMAAYRIIQRDILRALTERKEESLEAMK